MTGTFLSKRARAGLGAAMLSAITLGGPAAAMDPARLNAVKAADVITQRDIDRAPGGYRLTVPGVGDFYVMALKAPAAGKDCRVHKPSLIKAIAADPPKPGQTKWTELSIYKVKDKTYCFYPPGGACYQMIKAAG